MVNIHPVSPTITSHRGYGKDIAVCIPIIQIKHSHNFTDNFDIYKKQAKIWNILG